MQHNPHEARTINLVSQFNAALFSARLGWAAIPDDIDLDKELELIDAAGAPAFQLADEILALEEGSIVVSEAKKLAREWLDQ